jgi:hypothetical protein
VRGIQADGAGYQRRSRVLFFAVNIEGRNVSSGEIASDLTNRRNGLSD